MSKITNEYRVVSRKTSRSKKSEVQHLSSKKKATDLAKKCYKAKIYSRANENDGWVLIFGEE